MESAARFALLSGSITMLFAVVLGAFGAHGLKSRLAPELMAAYKTGVEYQVYHALGLLLLGILIQQFPAANGLKYASWLMLIGIVLFSGSLYTLALSGLRPLGMVTPLGGLAFILAWALLTWSLLRTS